MKVINDIIASLEGDYSVHEVRSCVFWTAVMSRGCGLASTLRDGGPHHTKKPVPEAGNLTSKSARELAECANSDSLPEASIGMAAINSLIEIDRSRCVERNAFEILKEHGEGRKIAIVGHFPFIPKLRQVASELWVIEKRPAEGDLPEERAAEVLGHADVVGITGTSLINHTFEGLIKQCRNSFVVMLGPSTPLSPVLFDYGVDVLSGVSVNDKGLVLRCISEGASFRQVEGVELLTMTR